MDETSLRSWGIWEIFHGFDHTIALGTIMFAVRLLVEAICIFYVGPGRKHRHVHGTNWYVHRLLGSANLM